MWDAMRAELDAIDDRTEHVVLPKSDLRGIRSITSAIIETELTRYLDDPQLPLDNNDCEQLMGGSGDWPQELIFAGSLVGGERNAGFLTLVGAHRVNIDVWADVDGVLKRLLAGETDHEPLLP
ncbi:MAG: hypothetical protein R3C28_13810 [Pirellulaceae bacterium]